MLRAHGVVGKFVELLRRRPVVAEPRRPGDDLEHVAGVRRHGDDVPDRRRDAALHGDDRPPGRDDRADRGLREGAGPVPHRRVARPRVRRDARARPRHGRARASPARAGPQDRVALGDVAGGFRETYSDGLEANGAGPHYRPVEVTVDGDSFPLASGSVAIAAITSCTNTSNPSVMVGRRACWPRRPSSAGLTHAAVGEDQPRARQPRRDRLPRPRRPHAVPRAAALRPGRLRLHHLHRQLGPAGRADRQRHRGERPRRGGGALGQPQLRGAHPPPDPGELPRLAAAGGGLRAGRPGGHRPHLRAARRGRRGQPGLPLRDLADAGRGGRGRRRRRSAASCSSRATRRSSTATTAGARCRCPRARPTTGTPSPPTSSCRPSSSGISARARADHRHRRRAGARGAGRLDHHRPHLAGRQHPGQLARRALPAWSTAWSRATSTASARGAATTR